MRYYAISILSYFYTGGVFMNITEKMFNIMQEKNIEPAQLARKLGIKNSVISSWENRNTNPPSEYILPICELLDINVYELLSPSGSDTTSDERELLTYYRECSKNDRNIIRHFASRLSNDSNH